jgi:hypothetical protein
MFDTNIAAVIETNENSVVVLSDTKSEQMPPKVVLNTAELNKAMFRLEKISNERELWEVNEYAASRKRLYELLTQCYDYYLEMKLGENKAIRDEYKKALSKFCEDKGYNFQSSTHDMNRIVKAAFGGSDRRRISAYAKALIAALTEGRNDNGDVHPLLVSDLTNWIESQGGVEEIRTGSKNLGMSRKEQAQAAAKYLGDKHHLGTVNADFKSYGLDINDSDKQMVLVVTYRVTGQLEINAIVKDKSAVDEALACHYKKEFKKNDSKNEKLVDKVEFETI